MKVTKSDKMYPHRSVHNGKSSSSAHAASHAVSDPPLSMAFTTVWHKEQAKPCVPETPIAHRTVKRIAFMLIDSDGACASES